MQEQWEAIVSEQAHGPVAAMARVGLGALALAYRMGLAANLWVYTSGLKPRTQPVLPVVSVGNLSLGGAGKTTAAAFIATYLRARVPTAIVLRGYRRAAREGPLIVSDGQDVCATLAEAGDEALMLARRLRGCAVAVGKRRERVIAALAAQTATRVVVLDDGFQYFRMQRDLDIVLLDALTDAGAGRLFPAGRLREPPAHLARADQVWITHADLAAAERVAALVTLAGRHCPDRPVVTTRHKPGALRPLVTGTQLPTDLSGRAVIAVCALGNPRAFEMGLRELGARVEPVRFADHHAYAPSDYDRVSAAARRVKAELVVTTEKDAVKLPAPPGDCPPVAVLGCALELMSGHEHVTAALDAVCHRSPPSL